MSYYTYFSFGPISLKFIIKTVTLDYVSRGTLMSWPIAQNPCKYPKPELWGEYSGKSAKLPFQIIMLPFLSCPPAQEYLRTTFFLSFTHEHNNRYDGHCITKMFLDSVMSDQVHESIS